VSDNNEILKKLKMKYENLKEFIVTTKSSKSTIYRFYRKNEDLFIETKLKSNKRMFPCDHARYFDSEIMHDENKLLRLQNSSMRSLINCLMDRKSLPSMLWAFDWSFFYTVAYKAERNKISCFKQMNGLYEHLNDKYGSSTAIRLFFSTEPFDNRKGYHNHFVLHIANKKLHVEVMEEIRTYFSYDRVEAAPYDKYQAGLFYATKGGLVGEDWDILGNNLKQDGIDYANKGN
jgi:hypothetical protein